ncbi:hypothetical protein TNCV_988381 [Trichonephila clavipes]|nr:hypothetical protein TNCV_988381 [Trichonephila clavipes]
MPYSGLKPEHTWLQVEGHIHHTGWAASKAGRAFWGIFIQQKVPVRKTSMTSAKSSQVDIMCVGGGDEKE